MSATGWPSGIRNAPRFRKRAAAISAVPIYSVLTILPQFPSRMPRFQRRPM